MTGTDTTTWICGRRYGGCGARGQVARYSPLPRPCPTCGQRDTMTIEPSATPFDNTGINPCTLLPGNFIPGLHHGPITRDQYDRIAAAKTQWPNRHAKP